MNTSALTSLDAYADQISACVRDAAARLDRQGVDLDLGGLQVRCMTQTWPSTACGFPGAGGRAMTRALTVAVICDATTLVYIKGRLAYQADTSELAERLDAGVLFGQIEWIMRKVPAASSRVCQIAAWAQRTLGQQLTAFIVGERDPARIGRYAAASEQPSEQVEAKLRAVHKTIGIALAPLTAAHIQAIMLGADPALNDRTPAEALHAGQFDAVAESLRPLTVA